MNQLSFPISYLEKQDFHDNGNLRNELTQGPVFIMIQAAYCPACTRAKPAFQEFAEKGLVTCYTIQIDGERETERSISQNGLLELIYPGIKGYPSFLLIVNGEKITYNGTRTVKDMERFVKKYIKEKNS